MKPERIQRKLQKYTRMMDESNRSLNGRIERQRKHQAGGRVTRGRTEHRPHPWTRAVIFSIIILIILGSLAAVNLELVTSTMFGDGKVPTWAGIMEKPLIAWYGNWTAPWNKYEPYPLNQTLGRGTWNVTLNIVDLLGLSWVFLTPFFWISMNRIVWASQESRSGIFRR